jgi:hypothetical protein
MTEQETPTSAFILSLIAGIIIFLLGITLIVMGTTFMSGMMGSYYPSMMGVYMSPGYISSMIAWFGVWGLICGAIIIYGATKLNSDPASHVLWGIIIFIISLLSGFLIGGILGIIGGILAIMWKPSNIRTEVKK